MCIFGKKLIYQCALLDGEAFQWVAASMLI